MIWMRDNGGLGQKWESWREVVGFQITFEGITQRFADELDMGWEQKRGIKNFSLTFQGGKL